MSYAAVASKHTDGPQPTPDQSLLEGHNHSDSDLSASGASDEKVHVVTRDEFEEDTHPAESSQNEHVYLTEEDAKPSDDEIAKKAQADLKKVEDKASAAKDRVASDAKEAKDVASADAKKAKDNVEAEAKKDFNAAKSEAKKDYAVAKDEVKKGAAEAEKKVDRAARATEEKVDELSEKGKAAYDKMSKAAQEDWNKLSRESKKRWDEAKNSDVGRELQKPEVWGSLLGVTNLAVLGSVAYFAYANWNKPRWDRKVVSGTVIAVGTWFGIQGWLIPQTDAVKQRQQRR